MSDDDKIDLRALDPSRDGARWERMVADVAARALAGRRQGKRRRRDVPAQLLAWAWPALALAAVLALLVWTGPLLRSSGPAGSSARAGADAPATQLAEWAETGVLPPTARLLEVLGDDDATE